MMRQQQFRASPKGLQTWPCAREEEDGACVIGARVEIEALENGSGGQRDITYLRSEKPKENDDQPAGKG